jgi:hypothetical protein
MKTYLLEVEFLTEHNFQTHFHTCTRLLDKYFEDKPCFSAENFKM